MAVTDTATPSKKRGDGPITFTFIDEAGKEHKRVPKGVKVIQAKPRVGDLISLDVSKINPDALIGFAVMGLTGKGRTTVLNHFNPEGDGTDIAGIVSGVFADAVSGNIYTQAEVKAKGTGKRGKPVDYDIIARAWQQARAGMAKAGFKNAVDKSPVVPLSDAETEDFKVKLQMLPKESVKDADGKIVKRGYEDTLKKLRENTFFVKALATLKANAVTVDKSTKEVEMLDI